MGKSIAILLALCACATPVPAATIHVPGEQPSIAAGLAAATSGDTVLVACGTYSEWDLSMPSGVTLRGATGIGGCVTIDAGGNSRAILLDGTLAGTRIEGIDITHGSFSAGPALYFWHAVAEVNDCVMVNNHGTSYGGAVYARYPDTQVTFNGCLFASNLANTDGGAIFDQGAGSLSVNGCTFATNVADRDGGAIYSYGGNATLTACTFDLNDAGQSGSAVAVNDATITLDRCLLTYALGGGAVHSYSDGFLELSCCDLFGNTGGDWVDDIADQFGVDGNISEVPKYCDSAGLNYLLQSDSPCTSDNSPCGLHIGAWDVGCPGTATAESSWSWVKSLY